jgi:DNA-binding XRE family transcriptional regulator/uncharacterized phage-associated protein
MTTSYAPLIKSLRERHSLSQVAVASRLGMSRSSYVAIEKGTKELSLAEAEALSRLFGITIDELLQSRVANAQKYKQMILLFLRHAKHDHKAVKKTKLAKLLYLADFAWFYKHLESMSGMTYRKQAYGPVPSEYFTALEELERDGQIIVTKHKREDGTDMYEITETQSSERIKLNDINAHETSLMKAIWSKWKDATTAEIVHFTHEQIPYKFAFPDEVIPYELITQEDPKHVF